MARFLDKYHAGIDRFSDFASSRHRFIGMSLLRICFGFLTTVFYALHLHQRSFLWGPQAVVTNNDMHLLMAQTRAWSLYEYFPSSLGSETLYWLGLIVSICFAAGIYTRITSILFFVLTWSVYERNYYAIDGGENLLIILCLYLIFADLDAVSIDRAMRGAKPRRFLPDWFTAMVHNAALFACLFQVAILYFISAFFKVRGHVWVNGTALYYILRTDAFSLPGWSDRLILSALFVTVGTYATILFELAYPWLVWQHRYRYVITAGAVLLHTGIAVFMGLPWFSMAMISVHVLLFRDSEYLRLAAWCRRTAAMFLSAGRWFDKSDSAVSVGTTVEVSE